MNNGKRHTIACLATALLILLVFPSAAMISGCTGITGLNSDGLQHSYPSPNSSSAASSQTRPTSAPTASSSPLPDRLEARIFYANSEKDPEEEKPDVTYPITLTLKTGAPEEMAMKMLDQLITGPDESYKKQGFYTTLDPATKVNSVKIEKGTIHIDFNNRINEGGGSSIMNQRRSQIEHTFLNMPGIKINKVSISVNGDTENVLQP
jgi:hypothetical protein